MAWFFPPFAAASRTMRLHRRGVDEDLHRRATCLRERVEQIDPDALGRPAHIAIIEGFSRPIFWWRIDPSPAGFQHVDDAADHPPIINARLTARVGRKMRRNLRELRVR